MSCYELMFLSLAANVVRSAKNKIIKCFMSGGSWVGYVQRDVAKALHDRDVVFVLVLYVILHRDNFEHCPCVISYSDATMLDVDSPTFNLQPIFDQIVWLLFIIVRLSCWI